MREELLGGPVQNIPYYSWVLCLPTSCPAVAASSRNSIPDQLRHGLPHDFMRFGLVVRDRQGAQSRKLNIA